jgi:outer membrane protein insertion porin family
MTDLNEAFLDPTCFASEDGCGTISLTDLQSTLSPEALEALRRNPFVFDSLLIGEGGRRTVSKIVPSFVHNTVDNPIFPNAGKRLTAAVDLAVLGGNTQFYKPTLEAIKFWRHTARTSFGMRGQFQFIAPVGKTDTLPIFEKLFLGGEYSVRGFDIRSIGPSAPDIPGLVVGGNKSFLFNAEYMFSIVPQVRLIAFYDAGQVADSNEPFGLDKFRTSTGAEVRFFMPVLNVPFRLIFAANPQRDGVLDNSFQPAKKFTFRFAVGSTF